MHPAVASAVRTLIAWIGFPWILLLACLRLDLLLGNPPLAPYARVLSVLPALLGAFLTRWTQLERQMLGEATAEAQRDPARGSRSGRGSGDRFLHTSGPYLLCRHPLYWGASFYLLGWLGIGGSRSGLLIVLPVIFLAWITWTMAWEEPRLLRRFGETARRWRAATPFLPDPRRWRLATRPPSAPPAYLFTRGLVRSIFRIWSGLEHPRPETVPAHGPLVLVANHRSYLDAFLLAGSFPRPIAFLSAEEAYRPLWSRTFLLALGTIRLRRHRPDPAALLEALAVLEAGGVVGIFPEGERSWDGGPSPILPGVARFLPLARTPVMAVKIEGSYRLWPRWGRGPRRAPVRVRWSGPVRPPHPSGALRWLVDALADHPPAPSWKMRSSMDVGRLIWRCPDCGYPDAIRGRRDGGVFCRHCGSTGVLYDGTHLAWGESGPRPLRTWARVVALKGGERRELGPGGPSPHRRWPFLRISEGEGDGPLTERGKGEAVLTPEALVLRTRRWRARIPAASIRSVAVEGSHKLQVATTRRTYELRYRRGSPRGPRAHLEAWLDARGIRYRRG